MFQYRQVLVRLRQGDTDREIARSGLMGRRKVGALRALALQRGWLDPTTPVPEEAVLAESVKAAKRARSTISSVEPHRALVEQWATEGVTGVVIHSALQRRHGYTGSYSSVQRMLRSIGRSRPPDATVHLTFTPGQAAQVDFGAGPYLTDPATGKRRRAWAFVMTLCFSRHQYVEFVLDQTIATWLGCHRRAFEWFSAVPSTVTIDNPKCAITRACRFDPIVQRAYGECAEAFNFRIDACPPADAPKKGVVESGVKYVKRNFLPLRTFRDLADLNRQAREWVMQEAGPRIHGTTRKPPLTLFAVEQPLLQPLPAVTPDLGIWGKVKLHRDCHAQFEYSYYSAPYTLMGKPLWLRATDTVVTLYHDFQLVATHVRARERGTWRTLQEHLPPDAQAFFQRDRDWLLKQAARVGPACTQFIDRLLGDRIRVRLRGAQATLGLGERYGAKRLEAACARALEFDSVYYRTVKNILTGRFESKAAGARLESTKSTVYGSATRFVRTAINLFTRPDAGGAKSARGDDGLQQLTLPGVEP
jgi:transposase